MMTALWSKEGMFFAYMLSVISPDQTVHMTADRKREAVGMISPDSRHYLNSAKTFMKNLEKKGVVKNMKGGKWIINPYTWGTDNRNSEIVKKIELWEKT